MFNPRFTRLTLNRLRTNSPAQMSSAIDSAICAVTSELRKRVAARVPECLPEFARSVVTRSGRVLWSAGIQSEQQACQSDSAGREHHHRRIERELQRRPRVLRREHGREPAERPARDQETHEAAEHREHDTTP